MKKPIVSILGILTAVALPAGAATLARYQFSGNYLNNITLPAGIASASSITFAAGLTETLPAPSVATGTGISSAAPNTNTLYVRSAVLHETTAAAAIGADDYFSFDVSITSGFTLNLNSVAVSHWSSFADYTSNVAVYYTLNGGDFSSEAVAVKLGQQSTASTTAGTQTFSDNLGGNEALTGTVRFHFVFWDPANTNLENRVGRFDDIIVAGTVTAVPEPVMFTLLLPVSFLSAVRRRR